MYQTGIALGSAPDIHLHLEWRGQPATGRGAAIDQCQRESRAAAAAVNAYVAGLLADDAAANIAAGGDFNEFQFEEPMCKLEADGATISIDAPELINLTYALPAEERYSYILEGNAQQIDHILVSGALRNNAQVDVVHANILTGRIASDHDPVVAQLTTEEVLAPADVFGTFGAFELPML